MKPPPIKPTLPFEGTTTHRDAFKVTHRFIFSPRVAPRASGSTQGGGGGGGDYKQLKTVVKLRHRVSIREYVLRVSSRGGSYQRPGARLELPCWVISSSLSFQATQASRAGLLRYHRLPPALDP